MIADPPVRSDGRCAACYGPRTFPKRPPHSSIDALIYERDAFCSTACARGWHGVAPPMSIGGFSGEARGRNERQAA